jgi:hypothetical protein
MICYVGDVLPKAHLTAVLGATGPLRLYWNWDNVAKDGNLLPTILLDYIFRVKSEQGFLPPVLYLQLDNTARENKNKFVMTFLALLVERGVFEKIKVNFLLVGHTHEVITLSLWFANLKDNLMSCYDNMTLSFPWLTHNRACILTVIITVLRESCIHHASSELSSTML